MPLNRVFQFVSAPNIGHSPLDGAAVGAGKASREAVLQDSNLIDWDIGIKPACQDVILPLAVVSPAAKGVGGGGEERNRSSLTGDDNKATMVSCFTRASSQPTALPARPMVSVYTRTTCVLETVSWCPHTLQVSPNNPASQLSKESPPGESW